MGVRKAKQVRETIFSDPFFVSRLTKAEGKRLEPLRGTWFRITKSPSVGLPLICGWPCYSGCSIPTWICKTGWVRAKGASFGATCFWPSCHRPNSRAPAPDYGGTVHATPESLSARDAFVTRCLNCPTDKEASMQDKSDDTPSGFDDQNHHQQAVRLVKLGLRRNLMKRATFVNGRLLNSNCTTDSSEFINNFFHTILYIIWNYQK